MRTGHHTHPYEGRISYKELRKINPEAARTVVLEYLKTDPCILEASRCLVLPGRCKTILRRIRKVT
jgi:hypothetical protein